MLGNILLSDLIDSEESIKLSYNTISREVELKAFYTVLFSSFSGDAIYNYAAGYKVEDDRMMSIISQCHKHLEGHHYYDNIKCTVLKDHKCFDDTILEVAIAFYAYNEQQTRVVGVTYFAVEKRFEGKLKAYFDDFSHMNGLSNTINLMQLRLDVYEKLFNFIDVFSELLAVKDQYMPYHMSNVGRWCNHMVDYMKLEKKEATLLYIAALLHDIGKSYIPDDIINKPGKLTDEEYNLVKQHSIHGYEIAHAELSGLPLLDTIPTIIRSHHERYDGTGYPDGLTGEEIPKLARILSVCDTIDAMLSRRSYKDKNSVKEVIKELLECSGKQFDPEFAAYAIEILKMNLERMKTVSISNMDFIPMASLSYYMDSKNQPNQPKHLKGNLVISDSVCKLILHSNEKISSMDVHKMKNTKISFLNYNDIVFYKVNITGIIGNQLVIKDMIYEPLDRYFALVWEVEAIIIVEDPYKAKIIKIGSDQLVVLMDLEEKKDVSHFFEKEIEMRFHLKVNEVDKYFNIQARVTQHYRFEEKHAFICRYEHISTVVRDNIIKMMLRKQKQDRMSN